MAFMSASQKSLKSALEAEHFGNNIANYSASKLDRLFELAWEHGHSNGESEVSMIYSDLADLVL